MQKALELLDQIEDVDENPYHKTRTIIFDREDMAFIKEAREELEALQQSKSCYDCKHWFPNKASYPCNQCSMAINCLFEPKEQ